MELIDSLQINTLSIVFAGEFNPVIIQPFWLAHKKLIREQEAENAKVDLIHHELVRIDFDWAFIEITKDRFEIRSSKEPYFEPVRDLALGIFNILKETPIRALGMNHIFHFALNDERRYYDFGDKLAPLKNWNTFMKDPKMLQLEIFEKTRPDGLNGHYRVRIQPSDQISPTNFGVAIYINNHFSVEAGQKGRNREMLSTLAENWSNSFTRASDICNNIWKSVNQ
jgi:hypothetical protein